MDGSDWYADGSCGVRRLSLGFEDQLGESVEVKCTHSLEKMRAALLSADWSTIIDTADQIEEEAIELADRVDIAKAAACVNMFEMFLDRRERETEESGLTFAHVAIATICRRHALISAYLSFFYDMSSDLPPNNAYVYFADCAHIWGFGAGKWSDAAVHAALAYTVRPSVQSYRIMILTELAFRGASTTLPRAAWLTKSALVDNLAQIFNDDVNFETWRRLLSYCKENQAPFAQHDLVPLLNRAVAVFAVRCIESMLKVVSTLPLEMALADLEHGVSFDELEAAGLHSACDLSDGVLYRGGHGADPMDLLEDVSKIAQVRAEAEAKEEDEEDEDGEYGLGEDMDDELDFGLRVEDDDGFSDTDAGIETTSVS